MAGGWKVWGELRRRPHLELVWAYLTDHRGRLEQLDDGRRRVVIEATLDQTARRATLAHELVHDERDLLFDDDTPLGIVTKEEAIVEAETARRLVPLDELDQLVRAAVLNDGCVTWREVADWFDVPHDVADHALGQLERRARGAHPASQRARPVDRRHVA